MLFNEHMSPAGEAIVAFNSVEEAYRAVAENNKTLMGSSVIEISLV